jgi:hypothetical protein
MQKPKAIKLTPVSKVIVSLSTAMIVAVAAYNWAVAPQASYLHAAQLYEDMVGDTGNMTEIMKEQLDTRQESIDVLHREIAAIQGSFFTPKQANEFFLDLEPISHSCQCNVDKLSFMPSESIPYKGNETEAGDIVVKRLAFSFTGTYKNIIVLLKRLTSYSQRIVISDVYMQAQDRTAQNLFCQMIITIYTIEDKELKK